MLEGLIQLYSYPYFGGAIGQVMDTWTQAGVFSYVVPFLVIFALVFGILNQMRLFKQSKSVNAILALAVGLMAIQFDLVPRFFSEIFPRLGVGLAIILSLIILAGMFVDPNNKGINIGLLVIGAIILVIVLVQTAGSLGWSSGYWWYDNWQTIVGIVVIIAVLLIIVGMSSPPSNTSYKPVIWSEFNGGK